MRKLTLLVGLVFLAVANLAGAFEVTEGEVVVLDLNGEAPEPEVLGNSFGYSPALVYTVFFQAEIEVVRSSMMLLDYKSRHFHRFLITGDVPRAFRLSGLLYAQ